MNLLKILNEVEPNGELLDTETALKFGRKVAEQALELAAERSQILDKETGISWTGILIADGASYEVDKQSILSIIDGIE